MRFANRRYQLVLPVYPGQRGVRVVIEHRLDGSMAIRFGTRYLAYREIERPAPPASGERSRVPPPTGGGNQEPAKVHRPPPEHP